MIRKIIWLILIIYFTLPCSAIPSENDIDLLEKRTIIALYKASETPTGIVHHPLHRFLEMPLNHLGLKVVYWNIEEGLPDLKKYTDLKGIISWYLSDDMENPKNYIQWAKNSVDSGLKFLIIGLIGCERDKNKNITPLYELNILAKSIGFEFIQNWKKISYDINFISKNQTETEFEQTLTQRPTGLPFFRINDIKSKILLSILSEKNNERPLPAIFVTSNGGFAVDSLMIGINPETSLARWHTNPFYFLKHVFETQTLPKPDTTTLNGKRIYFSHIDGDGWQNISNVKEFEGKLITCAEVILKKVIHHYTDLPITIAPIAADLDPEWHGTIADQEIAKKIFAEPNVDAASHTYSHPLYWAYYNDPNVVEREKKEFGSGKIQSYNVKKTSDSTKIAGYALPRAFLEKAFNLKNEMIGAAKFIKKFLPPGKDIKLVQWSGDCEPFENALAILRKEKFLNMNGGDSRFDEEYPSYSNVAPIGHTIGEEQQIYAANSNENTYTNNWTGPYFGFKYLKRTLKNTEFPIRVKPINIYYHMYSGENDAALNALLGNLKYARNQNIIPIHATHYAEIAQGFYTTQFLKLAPFSWLIQNRGNLQTIRFDDATDLWINFSKSKGIIGGKHFQGSLYLFLDKTEKGPIITLEESKVFDTPPLAVIPYLHDSNWEIWDVNIDKDSLEFKTFGFSASKIKWIVPHEGSCTLIIKKNGTETKKEISLEKNNILEINGLISKNEPIFARIIKNK